MKEYISKDYIYSILAPRLVDSRGAEHYAYDIVKKEIDYAPKSEIVHFNHGTWEYWAGNLARCPVCGYEYVDVLECNNFCGNCGAIMHEEEPNGRA